MASTESDAAAQLIERLLVDPAFRARFRRNPAAACREAGLESLAQEMQIGAGKAMMTLDLRESKSSLAGVMMAAAMEGVGVVQFAEHIAPHLDDIPEAIGDVLSRVNLPAIGGGLSGGPEPSTPPPPPEGDEAAAGVNGVAPAAAAPAVAPPAEPPAAVPEEAAASPEAAAAAKAATPEEVAAADPAKAAAEKIKAAETPEAKTDEKAAEAVAEIADDAEDLPGATDMPKATAEPQASVDVGGKPAEAAPAAPAEAAPTERAAAPAEAAPAGSSEPPDPSEYGLDGKGGEASPEGLALLKNKNITLDETGVADIKAGKIDPRVIAMLTSLSEDHELTVTSMCSDHPRSTAGGSISNHSLGRGFDIGTVDGEIVRPNSAASRELATQLSELPESIRPDEIGTPWAINGPGYFTDGAHQDHLHMGFKQEIAKDWKPPANVAASAASAVPAVAAAAVPAAAPVPGAPAAAAAAVPAPPKPGGSGQFMAVKAEAAGKKGDSGSFMAVAQPPQAVVAAAPEPAAAGAGDAAAASADLSGVSGDYPGDDAPKEQLAAWLGKEAEKRGLPPELPVMASLVESGVKNLNFGDADSVGFFQMRVGIWNQGEYEGFPEKPELQAKWFLDTAEQVKKARVAAGKPVDDPSQFGEWIADVERPAEQYRGRYQLRLDEAKDLLEKGAGSSPAAPAAAAAAAPPEVAAAAAPAPPKAGDSGQFMAAKTKSSGKRGTTVQFMKSVSRADGGEPAAASSAEPRAAAPTPPPVASPPADAAAAAAPDAAARSDLGVTPLEDLPEGPDDYPGNDASKDELAKWLAKEAKKAGLPPELPVMASLVESGVKNLNYGDADSVGFFQMRVGIWNQGDYEGFPEKPELQAKWFIDNALAVKKAAIARGDANFGKDPAEWGEWIADIERPAEQYRGRYQLRLKEAQGLLKS